MDQFAEQPHAENSDAGIAVSANRPRALTITESEADIEMQLAPENTEDSSKVEEDCTSPEDASPPATHAALLTPVSNELHPDQPPKGSSRPL